MKKTTMSLLLLMLASVSPVAAADPWKDESGKGRHGREYKEEFWDGHCKVERKWKKGEYKEKRKCERPQRHYSDYRYDERRYERPVVQQRYYAPDSNYYPDYDGYRRSDPEVRIDVRVQQ